MPRHSRVVPTILICAMMIVSVSAAQTVTVAGRRVETARIDNIFNAFNRTDSPGCAVALVSAGEVAFSKGYGMANLEQATPIQPDTVFYAGSVSKQFVAFSVALLVESGRLNLSDDIRKYLPEIRDYGHVVTIRHLIHHTSGLRDYLELWGLRGRSVLDTMIESEVLDLIARQEELNFPPGERHLYSNTGYFLLAEIVKRVTDSSLREFTAGGIFEPLGMRHSHFHDDQTHVVANKAESYFPRDDGAWGALQQRFALVGSGGLYTSVEDLAKWDGNFYSNRLGQGRPALIDATLEAGVLNNGTKLDYAFGLFIGEYRGLETISHGGALGGYRAHLLRFPEERFSVIMMCNRADANPAELAERLADLVLSDRLSEAAEARPQAPPLAESPGESATEGVRPDSYQGHYFSPELDSQAHLFEMDGKLWLQFGYAEPSVLKAVAKGVFRDERGRTIEFKSGSPRQFRLQTERVRNLLFVAR